MPITIADLWLLACPGAEPDIRAPVFTSRQIEPAIAVAKAERRDGHEDWTAVDLEETIPARIAYAADGSA